MYRRPIGRGAAITRRCKLEASLVGPAAENLSVWAWAKHATNLHQTLRQVVFGETGDSAHTPPVQRCPCCLMNTISAENAGGSAASAHRSSMFPSPDEMVMRYVRPSGTAFTVAPGAAPGSARMADTRRENSSRSSGDKSLPSSVIGRASPGKKPTPPSILSSARIGGSSCRESEARPDVKR